MTRIYTINPRGEVVRQKLSQALSTSYVVYISRNNFSKTFFLRYKNLHEIVDLLFPPMDSFSASETYSIYTYWRAEPATDSFEEEMRLQLEAIAQRQKPIKSNTKTKGSTTPISGAALPNTTPITTVVKPGGEKLLTLAPATENTVKRA